MHAFLAEFLEEKGYEIKAAATVDDAIALLQQAQVDALVLDVRMPGRSGLEVLKYVRERGRAPDLPVLILTGSTFTPEEEQTIAAYRAYIFYKQENLEEFAAYIERLTHSRA